MTEIRNSFSTPIFLCFRLESLCKSDSGKMRLRLGNTAATFKLNSSLIPGHVFNCHLELIIALNKIIAHTINPILQICIVHPMMMSARIRLIYLQNQFQWKLKTLNMKSSAHCLISYLLRSSRRNLVFDFMIYNIIHLNTYKPPKREENIQ